MQPEFSIPPSTHSLNSSIPSLDTLSIKPLKTPQENIHLPHEVKIDPSTAVKTIKNLNTSELSQKEQETLQQIGSLAEEVGTAIDFFKIADITEQTIATADSIFELTEHLTDLAEKHKSYIQQNRIVKDMIVVLNFGLKQLINRIQAAQIVKEQDQVKKDIHTLQQTSNQPEAKDKLLRAQKRLAQLEEASLAYTTDPVSVALAIPNVVSSSFSVLKWLKIVNDIAPLSFGLSAATHIAGTVSAGIEMDKAMKSSALQEAYTLHLQPLPGNAKIFNNLLEKRNQAIKAKLEKEKASFERSFGPLLTKGSGTIDSINWKKEGIDLSTLPGGDEIKTIEDFNTAKTTDPKFLEYLLTQRINHKEGLARLAKNLLKERLLANQQISKKFFFWKELKSILNFSFTTMIAAAAISMGVLVLLGIALPVLPILLPTLLGLALGVAFIATGLIYLMRYKPHLLKEMMQGVKFQLFFNNIPKAFHAWRLGINNLELIENQKALKFLSAYPITLDGLKAFRAISVENVPPSLKPLYQKLQAEKDLQEQDLERLSKDYKVKHDNLSAEKTKLDQTIKDHTGKFEAFKEKVNTLQERLKVARAKDFELNSSFKLEDFELIGEALVTGEFWEDEDSARFIKNHLGIDSIAHANQSLDPKMKEKLKSEVIQQMRQAIQQTSAEFLTWLENKGTAR